MRRLAAALLLLAAGCDAPQVRFDKGPPPDWDAVKSELAWRVERDQELREQAVTAETVSLELVGRIERVDADNTAWLKDLVTRHGWPSRARVGEKGAGDAWLLAQHADQDVEFQEHCLALLRAAVELGQVDPKHVAYLSDRVATHRGRPQRYGTQFVEKDGVLQPYELEDPAQVDKWRAEVGLGPLAEYAEELRKL